VEDHSITRFFNQLIKIIREDKTKSIGIITDKDGTLLFDDQLKKTLKNFSEKKLGAKFYLIANSGRTIQDMINCLEDEDIPVKYFDYIIGDNGGICLDVKHNKELYKHTMNKEVVKKVIDKFKEIGGDIKDIRFADGKKIYAYPSEDVKKYYEGSRDIEFREDILDLEGIDITKLTLASTHGKINKINKYIREEIKGYRSHIGKTSFPKKENDNYRLDFTRHAYKRTGIIWT